MSDILVSIIESVADAAAAARARRAEVVAKVPPAPAYIVQRFREDEPPERSGPAPVVPDPVATPRPAAAEPTPPARQIALRRLFADPQSLIRTVVAAEILGPPLALRRQNLWDSPSV